MREGGSPVEHRAMPILSGSGYVSLSPLSQAVQSTSTASGAGQRWQWAFNGGQIGNPLRHQTDNSSFLLTG